MKNWSVDTSILVKNPEQYEIWRAEQMINFGLDGEKLSREFLLKNIDKLYIDSLKKRYLKFLLKFK